MFWVRGRAENWNPPRVPKGGGGYSLSQTNKNPKKGGGGRPKGGENIGTLKGCGERSKTAQGAGTHKGGGATLENAKLNWRGEKGLKALGGGKKVGHKKHHS